MTRRTLTIGSLLAFASIAAGLMLLLTGCQSLANIQNPRYAIRDIRPRIGVSIPPSIEIDFALEVDNPNPVGLRLDQVDFNLLIDGKRVLDTISQHNVQIPANGRSDIQLHARLGYSDLRSIWNEISDVIRGQRARYEIQGTAYYATPMGRLKFPLTVYSSR